MKKEINIEILLTNQNRILSKVKDVKLRREISKLLNMAYELGKKDIGLE